MEMSPSRHRRAQRALHALREKLGEREVLFFLISFARRNFRVAQRVSLRENLGERKKCP